MDSRFFITVALERASYQKTLAEFNKLSRKADEARMRAANIGKGYKVAAKEQNILLAGIERTRKALLGLKAPGVAPYKQIEKSLQASKLHAAAIKANLATIPNIYSKAGFAQLGAIRTPTGGGLATPTALIQRQAQLTQPMLRRLAAGEDRINRMASSWRDASDSARRYGHSVEDVFAAWDHHAASEKKRQDIEKGRGKQWEQQEKQARKLDKGVERLNSRLEGYNRALWMVERGGSQGVITAQNLKNKIGDLNTELLGVRTQRDYDKIRRRVDGLGKDFDQAAKKSKNFGKQQAFINSRFGKFSIIMSGLAATLFVWQNIVRVVRQIVGIGKDMEVTFAKVADKLALSTEQMQQLETAARAAQGAGGIKATEYTKITAELVKTGNTLEEATDIVDQILAKDRKLIEGKLSGLLEENLGLWRNVAEQLYKELQHGLIPMFRALNAVLRKTLEVVEDQEKRRLHPGKFTPQDIAARGYAGQKSLFEYLGPTGDAIVKHLMNTQKEVGRNLKADFEEVNYSATQIGRNLKEDTEQVRINLYKGFESAEEFYKIRQNALKAFEKFIGIKPFAVEKEALEEIRKQLQALKGIVDDDAWKKFRDYLHDAFDLKQQAAGMKVLGDYFRKTGIMTPAYSEFFSKQRQLQLDKDLAALDEWAKKYKNTIAEIGGETIQFKPVPSDFNLEQFVEQTVEKYSDVDKATALAVMKRESSFDPYAIGTDTKGRAAGLGLMQVTRTTAKDKGLGDPTDYTQNIEGGIKLLDELIKKHGSLEEALYRYYGLEKEINGERQKGVLDYEGMKSHVEDILKYVKEFKAGATATLWAKRGPTQTVGVFGDIDVEKYKQAITEYYKFEEEQAKKAPIMRILKNRYTQLGKMHIEYFRNQLENIEKNRELMTKALEAVGIKDAQVVADSIANRQRQLLVWDKIYADQIGLTKDAITALEKLFDETGYYDPRLAQVAELNFQQRMKRVLASFKIGPEISPRQALGRPELFETEADFEKYTQIEGISRAKKALEDLDNERRMQLEGWQAYYDATGKMAEAHVASEKQRNEKIIEILKKSGMKDPEIAKVAAELTRRVDEKAAADKIKSYQMLYNETGIYTQEYYAWEIEQARLAAEKIKEYAGEKAASEYEERVKAKARIKDLLTSPDFADGMRARQEEILLETETNAEKMRNFIKSLTEDSRRIFSDNLFSFMQGEFESLEDIFKSVGDSFQAMLHRMAADILAAELGKLLFGTLASGMGTGTMGGIGSLFGGGGGGLFDLIAGGISSLFGGGAENPINPMFEVLSAKGNVFNRAGIKQFATGGIVTNPTLFNYADGTGLMGEAGPEAIMPLSRTATGELGVKMTGETKTINISPTIIVQAPEGKLSRQSIGQITSNLGRTIQNSMRRNT
jgi:hypothetical protein